MIETIIAIGLAKLLIILFFGSIILRTILKFILRIVGKSNELEMKDIIELKKEKYKLKYEK